LERGRAAWEERHDAERLREALECFERVVAATPDDYEALVYLCRGSFWLATAHTSEPDTQSALWDEGVKWGERALATADAFRASVVEGDTNFVDGLASLDVEQIEALYWTASNLGNWLGSVEDKLTKFKYTGRLKAMVTRVGELDDAFEHAGVPRFWGVFHAEAPPFVGGSLDQSRADFDECLRRAPDYFENRVLFAEKYATRVGDRELFVEQLERVLATEPAAVPDALPEQIMLQRRARELLARVDELF